MSYCICLLLALDTPYNGSRHVRAKMHLAALVTGLVDAANFVGEAHRLACNAAETSAKIGRI